MDIKFNFKGILTYIIIVSIVALFFFAGTYIFVTLMQVNALFYIIPAYIGFGIIKLILLKIYWKKK